MSSVTLTYDQVSIMLSGLLYSLKGNGPFEVAAPANAPDPLVWHTVPTLQAAIEWVLDDLNYKAHGLELLETHLGNAGFKRVTTYRYPRV